MPVNREQKILYDPALDGQLDITFAQEVEIIIREDGRTIWINVDGVCRLRICQIIKIIIEDKRKKK